jgi:hypothetical protein
MIDPLTAARDDALSYAASLRDLGYDADVWRYRTALNDSGQAHAYGFAVEHGPNHPNSARTYGLTVLCEAGQLPLAALVVAGRALISFNDSTSTIASLLEPWYVAGHNPRETDRQRDPLVNPGTMQLAHLHRMRPYLTGSGPRRFYDLRLTRVTLAGVRVDARDSVFSKPALPIPLLP